MITQKKWAYSNSKLFPGNIKKVVPKRELFQILSQVHTHCHISHRGHKTSMKKWLQEIMQKSASKLLKHALKCAYSMLRKCPPTNGSSNIPLFDRDRLNGIVRAVTNFSSRRGNEKSSRGTNIYWCDCQ